MSSDVLAKAQDFSKHMSHMQASTQATWHLNLLSAGTASGSSQAMLPGGCSTVAMPPLQATASKRSFPQPLCCPALRSGRPSRCSGVRKAGGPPGRSLRRLYSLHGGAKRLILRLPTSRLAKAKSASRSKGWKWSRPNAAMAAVTGSWKPAKTSRKSLAPGGSLAKASLAFLASAIACGI